jgi:predicted DNA-binding helix-hairpin-helix protein
MYLKIKVIPDSKSQRIEKMDEDSWKIWVKVPAENNAANTRVLELIREADFGNIQNLMGQIQNLLNQKDIEPKPDPIQQKPFNKMTTEELRSFILDSINSGDFDKAAEARDELEGRGE